MDELEDALNRVLAIVGPEPKWWDRIDQFFEAHRPKGLGKRPRKPRGIKDYSVKWRALLAYDEAPPRKKIAAECEVYKRLTGKVPNSNLRRQYRRRVRAEFKGFIAKQLKRNVTDK
jgi:hypothetical protein